MNQKHNVSAEKLGIQLSTGTLAGLAGGAVTVAMGETTVFVSATAASTLRPGQDFFPLTVDYRENLPLQVDFLEDTSSGKVNLLKGNFNFTPLRPSFASSFSKGFLNEVQVIGYLLSTDQINEADVLMVNGASAALMISDIPWNGPIGCALG